MNGTTDNLEGDNHINGNHIYDVIVIGAGVIGSSTAYWLTKDNVDTLVIEQVRGYFFLICVAY